jgi:hypothetical protein
VSLHEDAPRARRSVRRPYQCATPRGNAF